MADNPYRNIKERILSYIKKGTKPGEDETENKLVTKEGAMVFVFAYLIAISLWFAVNLNGIFNISINMPLEIGDIPAAVSYTHLRQTLILLSATQLMVKLSIFRVLSLQSIMMIKVRKNQYNLTTTLLCLQKTRMEILLL